MILLGDCLERMKEIPDQSVDMVLADPPYGTTACKWDFVIPIEDMWTQLRRIIKPKRAICIFGSEAFASHIRLSNLKWYKYDWVWLKSNGGGFLNANRQPLKRHECIMVFSDGQAQYFPQKTPGKPYRCTRAAAGETTQDQSVAGWVTENKGDRFPLSYQKFKSETGYHPTQKPVPLLEFLIKTYTEPQDMVLDFSMGSGSTGVAAFRTNRKFIGIELDQKYLDIAEKRINEVTA